MHINIKYELELVNYLKSDPYLACQKQIQHGIQYTLKSGIICNFHYSDKTTDEFSFTIQNNTKDVEQASLICHFAEVLAKLTESEKKSDLS